MRHTRFDGEHEGRRPGASKEESSSALLRCFVAVARHRGLHLSEQQLIKKHQLAPGGPTPVELMRIARIEGLRGMALTTGFRNLVRFERALPAIVLLRNGDAAVLRGVDRESRPPRVTIQDPNASEDALLTLDEFRFGDGWTQEVLLFKRNYREKDEDRPFGLNMVLRQALADRRLVVEIGAAAFILALLALTPIMFWRIMIDQVLYLGNRNTFDVLCIAMAMFIAFEMAFGYLRRYMVSYVSRDFDVRIWRYIYDKLLNLPLAYFEHRNTGEITRDVNELWKIRKFVNSELLGSMLDGMVLFVILPILFFFSVPLTLYVLGVAAMLCLWLVAMLPAHRRKAAAVFRAEGHKHSLLVESLYGVRTIKSLSLEGKMRQEWDVITARIADLRFAESEVANTIQTVALPFERLMTTGVIALAVYLAIATRDQFQIGALVAFMMLTMRMATPLSRLAQILPEWEEVQIAVNVIGAMINQPPEEGRGEGGLRTPIVGGIEFSDVRFRYPGATAPAIDGVSFEIPVGTIFGIMGRSGSGKTTVTRLLQRLHVNYEGLIKIDGSDVRAYDIDHLRSNVGVVLQENFLFRGTVHQTIAAANANATREEVIEAAHIAGADEFIQRLPRGYETYLQEGSTNLSGGQRQRLAIARALITKPQILILDEATSALDAESEAIVNDNLLKIASGRTLLIISHRLSSLICADNILVLEKGRVLDVGPHRKLLERCETYASLWRQQHRHIEQQA